MARRVDVSRFVFTATIIHSDSQGPSVVRDVLVAAGCTQLTLVPRADVVSIQPADKGGPDLIVLDLPDLRLLRRLVATQIPVVIVCGERDIDSAYLAGAAECVTTPVRPRELEGRIRRVLRQRGESQHRGTRERLKSETIRALTAERDQLGELVCVDPRIGIASRKHTLSLLDAECKRAARGHAPLGLVIVDVDFFSAYNETYGHVAGDACLRQIARALAGCLSHREFLGRAGGDELVAVLPDTDQDRAQTIAEALRAAVESLALPHEASLCNARVTVTAGYVALPAGAEWTPHAAIGVAHAALMRAKRGGHNRIDSEDVDTDVCNARVPRSAQLAVATAPTQQFAMP